MSFFRGTATPETYTLSLHDALPISAAERTTLYAIRPGRAPPRDRRLDPADHHRRTRRPRRGRPRHRLARSEEHTSELQSRRDLVCRLLLEKKKSPEIPVDLARSALA